MWLETCVADGLEPTTIVGYEAHLRLHIVPFIGTMQVGRITINEVKTFMNTLKAAGGLGGALQGRSNLAGRAAGRSAGTPARYPQRGTGN